MSNLYDEREQYLKMKEQMKDSMKLRAKRKSNELDILIEKKKKELQQAMDRHIELTHQPDGRLSRYTDGYLTLAKDQQRVRRAIYKTVIQSLFMIVFGIVLAIVIYSL